MDQTESLKAMVEKLDIAASMPEISVQTGGFQAAHPFTPP
jgi:hypothetical protein